MMIHGEDVPFVVPRKQIHLIGWTVWDFFDWTIKPLDIFWYTICWWFHRFFMIFPPRVRDMNRYMILTEPFQHDSWVSLRLVDHVVNPQIAEVFSKKQIRPRLENRFRNRGRGQWLVQKDISWQAALGSWRCSHVWNTLFIYPEMR